MIAFVNLAITAVVYISVSIAGVAGCDVEIGEVVKLEVPATIAFQYGGVILNYTWPDLYGEENGPHEYGHHLQQLEYRSGYIVLVVVPSLLAAAACMAGVIDYDKYRSMPWERDADVRSKEKRSGY